MIKDMIRYMRHLNEVFSTRFLIFVSIVYFAIKGYAFKAISNVELPFFKDFLGIDGDTYQKYYNVTMLSFAIKPLIGAISDNFPIFGYQKRYYLVFYCLLGLGGVMWCSTMHEGDSSQGPLAATLLFFATVAIAALDLLCEGKYSEIMGANRETGSRIVSWIWGCYMVGGIIAAAVGGPLSDKHDPKLILYIAAPFFVLPMVPALLGWIPEKKALFGCFGGPLFVSNATLSEVPQKATEQSNLLTPTSSSAANPPPAPGAPPPAPAPNSLPAHEERHDGGSTIVRRKMIALSIATSFAAIGTVFISLYVTNNFIILGYISAISVLLLVSSFFVLPRAAAMANVFMFMKEFLYLQVNGPVDYFFTADAACVPNGPHFDFTYYQTYSNLITNVAGILGVFLFQRFMSHSRFRTVFFVTTILKICVSFFDIMIVNRWNIKLGINDEVVYLFGDSFVYQAATMIDFMPASVLISRMCPEGLEATMFALLAGFSNFGQNLSRSVGYMVADWMHIHTVAPCNFDNLYLLIAIGHMVMPLLVLPLAVLLVPNERMMTQAKAPTSAVVHDPETAEDTIESAHDDFPESYFSGKARESIGGGGGGDRRRSSVKVRRSMNPTDDERYTELGAENATDGSDTDAFETRGSAVHGLRASLALKQY